MLAWAIKIHGNLSQLPLSAAVHEKQQLEGLPIVVVRRDAPYEIQTTHGVASCRGRSRATLRKWVGQIERSRVGFQISFALKL